MSIPHPATDPATPENIAARNRALEDLRSLREIARRLTRERVAAELRHEAEERRRDDRVEDLRLSAAQGDQEATRDWGFAVAQVAVAQVAVDETEAALVTARGNEETADLAVRDLSRKVWK